MRSAWDKMVEVKAISVDSAGAVSSRNQRDFAEPWRKGGCG